MLQSACIAKRDQLQRSVTPVVFLIFLVNQFINRILHAKTHLRKLSQKQLFYAALYFIITLALSLVMASKHNEDWQSSKKTVLQRNACKFNNELMSDVSFVNLL